MTHDEIVEHVAFRLQELWYEVLTECRPCRDSQMRADVIAFSGRRPEIIVEVKPTLMKDADLIAAVAQVRDYVGLARNESPLAAILPVVVAKTISPSIASRLRPSTCRPASSRRGRPFRRQALVWSLEMFDRVCARNRIVHEQESFLWFAPNGVGRCPRTFGHDFTRAHAA